MLRIAHPTGKPYFEDLSSPALAPFASRPSDKCSKNMAMEEVPLPRIPARIFSPKNSVRYGFIFRPITKLIMDWNPGQD